MRVRVRSIGICGSEVHMLENGFPIPVIPGHEFAGEIENGRAVGIEPLVPCGKCEQCATGDYNMCELGPAIVLGVGRDGGMAEEVIVPERCLVQLPSTLDVMDACLIEPIAVALHGIGGVSQIMVAVSRIQDFYDQLKRGLIPAWDLRRRYNEVFI